MIGVSKTSPYRQALISLINSINQSVPIKEESQVLLVMKLNTEEKIIQFNDWVKHRLSGINTLNATEEEIIRAAVIIDKTINICDRRFDGELLQNDFLTTHQYLLPFIGENYTNTGILQIGESHYVDIANIIDDEKKSAFDKLFREYWWGDGSEALRNGLLNEEIKIKGKKADETTMFIGWVNTRGIIKTLYEDITDRKLGNKRQIYTRFASVYYGVENDIVMASKYSDFAYFNFYQKPSIKTGGSIIPNDDYPNTKDKSIPIARFIIDTIKPEVIVFTSLQAYRDFFSDERNRVAYEKISLGLPHPSSYRKGGWKAVNAPEKLKNFFIANGYPLKNNVD